MSDDPTLRSSNYTGDLSKIYEWPRLWFSKGDGDAVKQKINGLSIGLDYTKVALAGVALGVTPVKVDFTGFKLDEKGINILGVTRWEWPWISPERDWAKKLKEVLQGKKKTAAEQSKKEEAQQKEERASLAAENLRKDVGRAHRRIDRLERGVAARRDKVGTVASGPNATTGNPKNIKSAALQMKELEGRLNSLMTALG
ncbi:hypothetical protein [Streptomyces sp. MBT27]|uniref:hypothetical protein n=1 Tax=Streptomyces sp. MBT27 TaxID=1488356 RepID=UPI00141D7692|nr:hypothetical protein [Streptomyces sp. MBT27]